MSGVTRELSGFAVYRDRFVTDALKWVVEDRRTSEFFCACRTKHKAEKIAKALEKAQ